MPTPKKGPRLGGSPNHQRKILANLAIQLIENGEITTTEAKAKMLQPYFEKLVTKGKRGTIADRRLVSKQLSDSYAVYLLFDEVVPEIDPDREGGYTRLTRIQNRKGDNAPQMVIQIVTEPLVKKATVRAAEAPAKKAARDAADAEVIEEAEEIVDEAAEEELVEELAEEVLKEAAEEVATEEELEALADKE